MESNASIPRKRHVLIVDDNVQLAHFFEEILKLHGYDATVFLDGAEALKYASVNPADAVICDLQMPGLEGDLFYATIERVNSPLARRFIFVTGRADDERYQKFLRTVEVPVLRKPVPVELLLAQIERVTKL
ncbi:MAG: response regulator [Pedosphaera sp.]|nr:response regulator [Pedosphaera sp.]